jgi:predicted outer membrane protein
MISTHVAAIKLFQNYVAQADYNPQVKQFAQSAIPVFRKHLRDAKKLPSQ